MKIRVVIATVIFAAVSATSDFRQFFQDNILGKSKDQELSLIFDRMKEQSIAEQI